MLQGHDTHQNLQKLVVIKDQAQQILILFQKSYLYPYYNGIMNTITLLCPFPRISITAIYNQLHRSPRAACGGDEEMEGTG